LKNKSELAHFVRESSISENLSNSEMSDSDSYRNEELR